MAESRQSGVRLRGRRRWSFGDCVLDETKWLLTVNGLRAPVESKPLELLRELLLRAGQVVTKDELLDTIWPDVTVVEASLPTAVGKLRRALGDDRRDRPIIETVARIGYRLAVPVELENLPDLPGTWSNAIPASPALPLDGSGTDAGQRGPSHRRRFLFLAGGLAIASAAFALGLSPSRRGYATTAPTPEFSQIDAANALRKLDVPTIEKMLAAGWNPNTPFDDQNNGAVNIVLGVCEWDPDHDRRLLLLMTRTLFDGGARLADRNAWGDTPYSIAKATRYCGPNHPATKMLRMMCYEGGNPVGDRCLADYRRDASGAVVRRY